MSFFVVCYCDLRVLHVLTHSFPNRRTSDLMALAWRKIAGGAVEIILLSLVISNKLAIDQLRDSRNRTGSKPINQAATRLFVHFEIIKDSDALHSVGRLNQQDRKSTRLNSSH